MSERSSSVAELWYELLAEILFLAEFTVFRSYFHFLSWRQLVRVDRMDALF